MWQSWLAKLIDDVEFAPGCALSEIDGAEKALGLRLPDELKEILFESNGVAGEYGLGLVWPIARIVADNLSFRGNTEFRELYMPFDSLLFFGDAGNGDQFAFPIRAGAVRCADVFVWNHEDDSRTWLAPSLRTFFEWWADGRISI
jgi:hypothetical protein